MNRPTADNADRIKSPQEGFAVVIPVYNHGQTVAQVAQKALKWMLPVIVVDDGSTDDSPLQVQSVQGIQLIRHPYNMGKGAALITGMTAAAKIANWAICLDADGQHDPGEIAAFVKAARTPPRSIVIGKRSGMKTAPWTSRFGRKFSNFWVWASGGPRVSDSQSGFRMYPIPEVLQLDVHARRYQYEVEILAKANWNGIPAREVPVYAVYHADVPRISHFLPWRDFWRNAETFSRLIFRRIFTPTLWFNRRPR